MKIEDYKLGQKVSIHGHIEAIDIENRRDIENTTTLKINTLARTISVNPKWEEVTTELNPPKLVVPQTIFDVIENFDEDVAYLYEHMSHQSDEVKDWLVHNERDFYEAWLAYPNITVQKEKLYTVKILGCTLFKMTSDNGTEYKLIGENETPSESKFSSYKFEVDLTEQEIKQADERLWQWKKEVENED